MLLFSEEAIDDEAAQELSAEDLKAIVPQMGHRLKIMKKIREKLNPTNQEHSADGKSKLKMTDLEGACSTTIPQSVTGFIFTLFMIIERYFFNKLCPFSKLLW